MKGRGWEVGGGDRSIECGLIGVEKGRPGLRVILAGRSAERMRIGLPDWFLCPSP